MACAHRFLSWSVNNVTHISALHEDPYFILAELQTKEKLSNTNRTQLEKLNNSEKKKLKINYHNFTEKKKSYQSHKKNKHNIARYFWTWFLSIDANLSQITFSLITSTLIPPHYILSAGRLSPDQPGNEEIFEFFFTVLMSTASMRTMFYILSFLSLTTKTLVQLIQAGHTNLCKSCSYVFTA